MIFEHEIPQGSRLYFGKIAKKKRELENKISSFFMEKEFDEIVTPNFSYSQHQSIDDETQLIKISDETNNQVALRADSTLDVARIITKRLGRTTSHKKWFYIQPVFTYPSNENYQMGVEWLEYDNVSDMINLTSEALELINIKPLIQVMNINIPKLVASELNIDLSLFKDGEVAKLFDLKIKWLDRLLYASKNEDLEDILEILPTKIKVEVKKLIDIVNDIDYKNTIVSPLYYTAMKYYDDVYYRVIDGNLTLAKGGRYKSEGVSSLGFALYTDNLLKLLED
ncbi:MAG: ATP phosphoribosyltransferase regulatory subunit [Arcobacteraceae bacterium]|nr:ATP phosphoribosyltransferase regulatory subunit [Arcobacteraceae bacterium]